jgi:hypothetical protein
MRAYTCASGFYFWQLWHQSFSNSSFVNRERL